MNRTALLVLPLLASALAACGGRAQDDQLMRRVAQAEEAANRAEAAASKAEDAARRATSGSEAPETVYEPAPDLDPGFGEGEEPQPADG